MLREKGFREWVSVKQFREWNIPVVKNGIAARRSCAEKSPATAKRFIRAAFEGIKQIYDNKESAMKILAKYTKVTDDKLLEESYRFSVEALSKDAFMPPGGVQCAGGPDDQSENPRRSGRQENSSDRLFRQSVCKRIRKGRVFQKALAVISKFRVPSFEYWD